MSRKHIALDHNGDAIYGLGDSPAAAIADAAAGTGRQVSDFCTIPASAALAAEVEYQGGAISWEIIGGVACLNETDD